MKTLLRIFLLLHLQLCYSDEFDWAFPEIICSSDTMVYGTDTIIIRNGSYDIGNGRHDNALEYVSLNNDTVTLLIRDMTDAPIKTTLHADTLRVKFQLLPIGYYDMQVSYKLYRWDSLSKTFLSIDSY